MPPPPDRKPGRNKSGSTRRARQSSTKSLKRARPDRLLEATYDRLDLALLSRSVALSVSLTLNEQCWASIGLWIPATLPAALLVAIVSVAQDLFFHVSHNRKRNDFLGTDILASDLVRCCVSESGQQPGRHSWSRRWALAGGRGDAVQQQGEGGGEDREDYLVP